MKFEYHKLKNMESKHLRNISDLIQYWIDWNESHAEEQLDDNHNVMCVPVWPSIGNLKSWINAFEGAIDRIEGLQLFTDEEKPEHKPCGVKIISNKIRCNHCEDTIESTYRHDYVTCKCGTVSVDGGLDYLKRSFKEDSDYTELSQEIKDE